MTKITIKKTASGDYAGFACEGHAGYRDKGQDVVCAALSVLAINTVNSLEVLVKEPMKVAKDEEKGLISVAFPQKPSAEGVLLLDSFVLGVSEIFKTYGKKHVQIEFEEV
ncbi:MAG: ribosomal-processing cysteine protease Prp [Lachnospiraceae bacterium]|jgi:uncharacterized protein YsxB (DUF464 family)|nr:ribosomal-processing cysteine protease Prp [Lachnospiraceae bacterium]